MVSTNVRAAAERAIKAKAPASNVPEDVVNAHCAHSAAVGQKHYRAKGNELLQPLYADLMPGV